MLRLSKGSQNPVVYYHLHFGLAGTALPSLPIALSTLLFRQPSVQIIPQLTFPQSIVSCKSESYVFQRPTVFLVPPVMQYTHSQSISSVILASWILLANQTQPLLWPLQGLFLQANYSSLCYLFHYFVSTPFVCSKSCSSVFEDPVYRSISHHNTHH